jgi:uncharacterized protein
MPDYRISQLKLPLEHSTEDIQKKICSTLGVKTNNILTWNIERKSFDARDKTAIRVIYAVLVSLRITLKTTSKNDGVWKVVTSEEKYVFPVQNRPPHGKNKPIIVGAGPAGLLCALILAENGYAPLVLERGEDAVSRLQSINRFWDTGILNTDSNMQFGEGGAGTFSDGKLNTTVHDKNHRITKILQEFILAGAPAEIAYMNKPHIGTDYLITMVQNLRKKIESLGGHVRFNAKVTSFKFKDGQITGVMVNNQEDIAASTVVLAIGHSARDTFEELVKGEAIALQQKPFAMGLRIEHPQEMIQRNQFGNNWNHRALPVADYKLTHHSSNGRGVYSFCMCPGGFVVNASSEKDRVVCNGMSNFARNGQNANSAIVVAIQTDDFSGAGALAGVEFQRKWEHMAFLAANKQAGFAMPIQRLEDFLCAKISTKVGEVIPSSLGQVQFADLNTCLPNFVSAAIKEGIQQFDRSIAGFAHPDAILTGVETRTSSPIRILRNESFQSISVSGVYPCGEGAGYAGGIMSAAIDGIRVAEAIAQALR